MFHIGNRVNTLASELITLRSIKGRKKEVAKLKKKGKNKWTILPDTMIILEELALLGADWDEDGFIRFESVKALKGK